MRNHSSFSQWGFDGGSKSLLYTPFANIKPTDHGSFFDSKAAAPFSHYQPFASKFKPTIAPHILRLLSICCPTAIRRFVISIRINSIYGMLRGGSFSHILQKLRKTIFPLGANCNPLASVKMPFPIFRIFAPCFYLLPTTIFFGSDISRVSMLKAWVVFTCVIAMWLIRGDHCASMPQPLHKLNIKG